MHDKIVKIVFFVSKLTKMISQTSRIPPSCASIVWIPLVVLPPRDRRLVARPPNGRWFVHAGANRSAPRVDLCGIGATRDPNGRDATGVTCGFVQ